VAAVADPRQLERWWGPPTHPATFTKHDLAPGSHCERHGCEYNGAQVQRRSVCGNLRDGRTGSRWLFRRFLLRAHVLRTSTLDDISG
jgi:hypothetical protein